MDLNRVAMTKYFKDDEDMPVGVSWIRFSELEMTPEGWLKGHEHLDNWFNTVESLHNDTTRDN